MIIPLYKPVGASTHQLASELGRRVSEKATHTGTLDPMADGVVIVLTGRDRFQKQTLSDNWKVYEVRLLIGVRTDTDDILGIVTQFLPGEYKNALTLMGLARPSLLGKIELPIHPFSAKRSKGSSYFNLSKSGEVFTPVTETVTIQEIALGNFSSSSNSRLLVEIQDKIKLVKGEFRQPLIIDTWQKNLLQINKVGEFSLVTLKVTCSKRTYVRSLVRELSKKTSLPLTVCSLTRTHNGPYSIKDCLCLI